MVTLIAPKACQTMTDLRAQIDAIDVELINLLATRSLYIDQAADLKKIEGLPVLTKDRVAARAFRRKPHVLRQPRGLRAWQCRHLSFPVDSRVAAGCDLVAHKRSA